MAALSTKLLSSAETFMDVDHFYNMEPSYDRLETTRQAEKLQEIPIHTTLSFPLGEMRPWRLTGNIEGGPKE